MKLINKIKKLFEGRNRNKEEKEYVDIRDIQKLQEAGIKIYSK